MLRKFGTRSVLKFELYGVKKISNDTTSVHLATAEFKIDEKEVFTTWERKMAELDFGPEFGKVKINYISCFSEFTKNPSKVINMTFFRLVNLNKTDDIVSIESMVEQQQRALKIFVAEEEVGMNQQLSMTQLSRGILKQVDQLKGKTFNAMLGDQKAMKPPQPGSTNEQIAELIGPHVNNTKFRLEISYQHAVERKG